MAKKNRPSPPGSPLETRIERFKAAAAEIWEKQDSAPLGNPLASGFDVLESYLLDFIQQFENDDTRLDKLEDLLKKAEELLKRLENIDLDGLDPEKIKQKVLDALTAWKADMEAALLALQNSDRNQNTRLDGLKSKTDTLAASDQTQNTQLADLKGKTDTLTASDQTQNTQLADLKGKTDTLAASDQTQNTQLADLKGKTDALAASDQSQNTHLTNVDQALQTLRDKDQSFSAVLADLEKKLGDLSDSDKKQTARIEEITKTLAELLAKLGGIDFSKLDPDKIKQAVLEVLAAWRSEVGHAILQLKAEAALLLNRVTALEAGLEDLKKKFDDIDFTNLDPEKIRQQVLEALVEWKKQLENTLAALEARTAALEAWKLIADQSLTAHATRLSLAETTLTGHTAAINRLRNDLEELEAEVSRIIAKGGADPEDIKNRVLAALQPWQALLDASIAELSRRATESERLLGDHSNTLTRHGSDIEALRKKIEEILASPHTPDVIVKLVIEALAEWRKQLEKRLAELQAAQATDHADIGRHTQQLADIRKQIEKIFQDIASLGQVEGRLTDALKDLRVDLESKLAVTDDRVDELEKLLREEVARLDARIKSIETTGIDPDDVREIIRTEFKAWQDAIENRIKTVETVTKGLRFGYDALIRRLVKLEVNSLDAEKVRQILRDELALWREQTDQAIAEIWKKIRGDAALLAQWQIDLDLRLNGDESDIANLKKALTDLTNLVNEKFAAIPDLETIKITVLDLFAEWRKKVDDRLTGGEATSRQLRDDLTELDRQVKELARSIPDAETLKNAILHLLDDWQKRIERKISALDTRTDKAEEHLGVLGAALKKLEDRVNELVLTGGTHIEVEKRLHEAIESWQKQLEKELNAIRDRNEQDRLALLQLRGTLDILQERVRKLENRDLVAEVLKILEDRLKAVEAQAKAADEKADNLIKRLDELTKTDGAINQLTKALELLRLQVVERPDRAEVQRMIDAALDGLAEWRRQTDTSIKILNIGLKKTNDDLNDLREQANKADRLINKDLEQKTTAIGDRINDLDQRTDARLDAAEKRLDEDETQDKLLEERLDHRLDLLEGWQTATNNRLHKAEGVDKEHDRRIAELQKQIDDWKPDASGNFADRLARRCLTGRGIVLGFDVWHTNKFTLNIGPGLGITSDGHMIRSPEPDHYTHYRRLETAGQYPFFVKKSGKPVDVWELVPESAYESGSKPLTPQRSADKLAPFIHDKVALALLPPSGTPPGEETKITFALVHREDLALLMQADRLLRLFVAEHEDTDVVFEETYSPLDEIPFEDDFYRALRPELSLEEIPLPRFGFQPRDKCTTAELDSTDFPDLHTPPPPPPPAMLRFFDTYKPIIEDAFNRLDWQLRKVIRQYSRLFFPQYPVAYFEDALDKLMMKWTDYIQFCSDHLKKAKPENPQIYVQYFYDWARDLVAAYHELRNELQFLMAASCIAEENDPKAKHPHHLMLGLAMREEHNGLASPLRHEFVQPPIYNDNAARLETCRLYFRRWFLLVKGFYLPLDKDPVANPTCHRDDDGAFPKPLDYKKLRITPGRGYFHPLSVQSLPFYYLVTLGTQSVHRFWHYRRAKTGTVNQLLCYHANDSGDSYSSLPHVIRPLYYSLDAFDFYRVEGHIGLHFSDQEEIRNLILNMAQKFNLDFDVVALSLNALTQQYDEIMLNPQTKKAEPTINKFFSFVEKIMGAEHLAGVPKGGTLVLVTEGNKVVADFSLPYRCCAPTTDNS